MEQEEVWSFGTAVAAIKRIVGRSILVRVRGAVTAMVLEKLHMRLGRECARLERTVIFEPGALLLVTGISAVEAAMRGTPATPAGQSRVIIGVPARRLRWAQDFCRIMGLHGLSRVAFALRPESSASAQLQLPL